jgi:hypothetical protein
MEPQNSENSDSSTKVPGKGICGIIMPMSGSGDYTAAHWVQIRTIIEDAAHEAEFEARIVSTSVSQGILQTNLVTNLYQDEIVVCDVSNNNPNVMLELGMRIAFGKPFIVIKDRSTAFSSDINVIIHEQYDRDMLYPQAKQFKKTLSELIVEKAREASQDNYKSFLSTFKVPNLNVEDIQALPIGIKDLLSELVISVEQLNRKVDSNLPNNGTFNVNGIVVSPKDDETPLSEDEKEYIRYFISNIPVPQPLGMNHYIFQMQNEGVGVIIINGRPRFRIDLSKKSFNIINQYIRTLGLDQSRLQFMA